MMQATDSSNTNLKCNHSQGLKYLVGSCFVLGFSVLALESDVIYNVDIAKSHLVKQRNSTFVSVTTQPRETEETFHYMLVEEPIGNHHVTVPPPIAVVHAGIRKTGSTTIQDAISKHRKVLGRDNFMTTFANRYELSACLTFREKTGCLGTPEGRCPKIVYDCSKAANYTIPFNRARIQNRNFLFLNESLHQVYRIDPEKLRKLFESFEIRMAPVYRRFYDWLKSYFGYYYRRQMNSWDIPVVVQSMVALLTNQLWNVYNVMYVMNAWEFYTQNRFHTTVITYHATTDIASSFFL